VKGHLALNTLYIGPEDRSLALRLNSSRFLNGVGFHSDVSFERQPPGFTMLTLVAVPPTGGDTVWSSSTKAYSRLSEPMQIFLQQLRAEHSGYGRERAVARRDPISTQHPLVRIHPVCRHLIELFLGRLC